MKILLLVLILFILVCVILKSMGKKNTIITIGCFIPALIYIAICWIFPNGKSAKRFTSNHKKYDLKYIHWGEKEGIYTSRYLTADEVKMFNADPEKNGNHWIEESKDQDMNFRKVLQKLWTSMDMIYYHEWLIK